MKEPEIRLKTAVQPLTGAWRELPVAKRGATLLGISFRPLQAEIFGLDGHAAFEMLLGYPFQLVRLGAYWNRIEPEPGAFKTGELDWQIEAAGRAGKQIILCVGPLKTFGYPEFFVPKHHLPQPFPEGRLVRPAEYPSLLKASTEFIARLVEHYRSNPGIVAWQLEHDAVDPLGAEHGWRLAAGFVEQEAQALREADPGRPVLLNGFLPTSQLVRLSQGWRTRDQGDSVALARRLADWVGIDYYARNALVRLGSKTLYLDGSQSRWQQRQRKELAAWAGANGKKLLVTEGQAEPWEVVTVPPNPQNQGLYSCLPEQVIINYNSWLDQIKEPNSLYAYLFWGAEYWLLRKQGGDASYLQAFARILEESIG